MAWIPSYQEVDRHPKTRKLARLLDTSLPATIGHLHLLWHWAFDYAEDGDLSRYDAIDIADAMLWEGEPQQLVDALIATGFVDDDLHIHDWWDYGGKYVKRREEQAERMRAKRAHNVSDTLATRSPLEKRREEKRREEYIDTTAADAAKTAIQETAVVVETTEPPQEPRDTTKFPLPDELKETLRLAGARRFKNQGQYESYRDLLDDVGSERYLGAVKWGIGEKGFGLSQFPAIATAAKKPPPPRSNGTARASPAVYHDTGPPVRTGAALEAEVDALLAEFGGDV